MNDKKQIEELADAIYTNCLACLLEEEAEMIARFVTEEQGYRKQSEECEKRIANQREEIRRLRTRINNLTQSRDVWKKQADRVGKQLHEVLSKQNEVIWAIFDDIDEIAYRYLNNADYSGGDMIYDLNELKKKYTEGEDERNNGTNGH